MDTRVLPSFTYNNNRFLLNPNHHFKTRHPPVKPTSPSLKNAPSNALDPVLIQQLLIAFEKPMPTQVGKQLVIKALENPKIAKLVSFPSTEELALGQQLSKAMKKYALTAVELEKAPKVKENFLSALEEARLPIYRQILEKPTQTSDALLFGAYPRDAAERRKKAAAIIASFALVNGGINVVAPPFVDFAATGLTSVAMGVALGNLYDTRGSGWTVATMTQVAAMLAMKEAPTYLLAKTVGWLSNFIGGPVAAATVQTALEGTSAAGSQAILGLAAVTVFELQIGAGQEPRFPNKVNQICQCASAVLNFYTGTHASHGIGHALGELAGGRGGELIASLVAAGGHNAMHALAHNIAHEGERNHH